MTAANVKSAEPSMEEILASIRKIITDDIGGSSNSRDAEEGLDQSSADIFDLSGQMSFHAARDAAMVTPLGRQVELVDLPQEPVARHNVISDPVAVVTELAARMKSAAEGSRDASGRSASHAQAVLDEAVGLSASTEASIASALSSLRHSIPSETVPAAALPETADSVLRSLVEAALRPVLSQWLDAHLPGIVERLVKAEIERIARER